ncbi:hypothetical protein QBC32DRAFT_28813 [Pseudoneurospora amorphoporcata]|uniref:Uncharacterized protein n=1 Tax=Pseudoneurospora amorphoporcata TaxID=241081 RepID=A0AAN6P0S9_9PEZI|nr:hypothetical protein QBC32DRAFT_28813 [Pseudoneurospora amorphoporcata]
MWLMSPPPLSGLVNVTTNWYRIRGSLLDERGSRERRESRRQKLPVGHPERERMFRERLAREGEGEIVVREKLRLEAQWKETRLMEAFQLPKWSADLVAEHLFTWLKKHDGSASKSLPVNQSQGLKDVAGMILHKTVLDVQFASAVFAKLELWKAWADNGGKRRSDMEALQGDGNVEEGRVPLFAFAHAAVLVALIKGASMAADVVALRGRCRWIFRSVCGCGGLCVWDKKRTATRGTIITIYSYRYP